LRAAVLRAAVFRAARFRDVFRAADFLARAAFVLRVAPARVRRAAPFRLVFRARALRADAFREPAFLRPVARAALRLAIA
jgi:hypothetical protein